MTSNEKEILEKRLVYQSLHRGCKEMDIILGNFVKSNISCLDENDLFEYEKVLETDDVILYKIFTSENELVPDHLSESIISLIKNSIVFSD